MDVARDRFGAAGREKSFVVPGRFAEKVRSRPEFEVEVIMDVRLLFKRADDLDLELWTTADFLGKASGYYKALFASGSTETVTRS
jgi:hypothetical protein